jgi:hypothetical protein
VIGMGSAVMSGVLCRSSVQLMLVGRRKRQRRGGMHMQVGSGGATSGNLR